MNKIQIKILMISSDRRILEQGSAVSNRMKVYGALVEELHIVILSGAQHNLKNEKISRNVWVYPTNSIINILRPLDAIRVGSEIIRDNKFVIGKSLITTQDPFECGWAGSKLKKKWRIPLEVQIHTDPFSPYFSGFQNVVRKFIAITVLRNADGVRVVTNSLKSQVSSFTKASISVLPIYIDRQKIEEGKVLFDLHTRHHWNFILLSVSRLAPEKNLALTIEILAQVREKFPDTGLVIVGTGPEESKLKKLIRKLGLTGAVEFAGWQDDLASFYKTADAFIQTSLFEGYGLSLVEVGLSGLPIISTPVGIALELEHGKDAYIYPLGNTDLFANGVIDLIRNKHKRENLRTNMKRTLEAKLISKEEYLKKLKSDWEKTGLEVT